MIKERKTNKEFSNVKMEALVDWVKYWDKFNVELYYKLMK
jgi:hypothetical protein